jgi:hypothetical protein
MHTPSSSWAFQHYQKGSDSPAGLRRGYGVVTSKQGITNTLALPIDKDVVHLTAVSTLGTPVHLM